MADAELLTRITLQNQEFQNEIRRCKQEIKSLKNVTAPAADELSGLGGMFGELAVAAAAAISVQKVSDALIDFGAASLEAYGNLEMLRVSFETILNSSSQANALIGQLQNYGANSPYDTEGLAKAAQLMLSYGMNASRVMPTLRQLGDIAMGDNNKLQSLALAFSQMSAAGKVCKQDLNQMINAGFNPLQVIAEQTDRSIGDLFDDVSKGKISVDQITQAFRDATSQGGQFYNMAQKQSNTLQGALASVNDEWTNFKQTLGSIIAPAAIKGLQTVASTIKDCADALMAVKQAIRQLGGKADERIINDYDTKTLNAIDYANSAGSKKGRDKRLNKGIKVEQNQGRKIDKQIRELDKKFQDQLKYNNYSSPNWDKKKVVKDPISLGDYKAQRANLVALRQSNKERIEQYKKELKNPYQITSDKPITSPTKYTPSKGGGRNTPSKEEVIPEGSLKALEKKLQEAQNAASLAVGEQAYQAAMATVKKIEDAIANFKWGGAGPNTAKNVSKIGTLDKTGGLVTNSTPNLKLPSMDELKPIGDIIEQDQIDEINKLAEALENAKGVFESYGGDTVGLQNQILDLAKAYKTTGDATSLAGAGMALVGQQMQALGENGAAAKAGAMMAAIGQIVLGFASASKLAGELGPLGWVAWLGAGLAALSTTISTVQSFSQGGIINGGSVAGDQMLARVNAGEMILNGSQQQKLFNTLDSNGAIGGGFNGGEVDFKISGSVLKGVLRNYDNKTSIL